MKRMILLLLSLAFVILAGCGGPIIPPGNLTAEGTLGGVELRWTPGTDPDLVEYRVYRRTNGAAFVEVDQVPQSDANPVVWSDTNVADGDLYTYRVTAYGKRESDPTNEVISMHGTRIGNQAASFTTNTSNTPYVIEGNISINGNLNIVQNTKLYILPGATVTFTNSAVCSIYVDNGLLGILGTLDNPVTITSSGGGVELRMIAAAEGCILKYAQFTKLKGWSGSDCVIFSSCSPSISNCRFDSDEENAAVSFTNTGVDIEQCLFDNFGLYFEGSILTGFALEKNIFVGGLPTMHFGNFSGALPASGQITGNVFQCLSTGQSSSYYLNDLSLTYSSATGTIALAGNYFYRGTDVSSPLTQESQFYVGKSNAPDANFGFTGLLSTRPADAGPGWGTLPF